MSYNLNLSHNIYKDAKLGTYYFRITYYDKSNTRKYITRKGFKQRKDAVKKCNEMMDELEGVGHLNRLPFDKLVEEYIDWYSARRKTSSVKALKTHTNNHLLPYFKSMDVFKMTTQDVMKFHELKQNVASLVGNFEIESQKRLNYWTLEQFNQFYEALATQQQKLFFKLLFYSGARKGEIRALTWRDINFDDDFIHINKTDYHGEVTAPKTKSAIRDIYLPTHMMYDIKDYLIWYKENNIYKDDYVLFGTFYKAYSESTIDRWFTNALKVLDEQLPNGQNFPRIVIHELRHSHASMLVNLGASVMIIAQHLGHSDTTEVYNRYGHLYPSTQKEIVKYL